MKTETLDELPGEGGERVTRERMVRRECEVCGEAAHFKHAFLLENFRTNPASSAYRRDDCTYCCDAEVFVCRECNADVPDGCSSSDTRFPATDRFKHLFLVWERVEEVRP